MRWSQYDKSNPESAKERFFAKVDMHGPNGCHLWKGAVGSHKRYGNFAFAGKPQLAHRAAWMIFRGDIPPNMCVCHKCDNGFCVNPDHLFLGTQTDNIHDMENKKRAKHNKGEEHGRAKLTWDDVRTIRKLRADGMAIRAIARMYPQIARSSITSLLKNRTWLDTTHQTISFCQS